MKVVQKTFFWFRHLNFDVGLASVASSIMAFKVFGVSIHFSFWIVLFISTWSIYAIDHIIDGIMENKLRSATRYVFYFKHRKILLVFILILGLFNIFLVINYLNLQIIYASLIMITLTIVYFFHIQKLIPRLPFSKDILSSLLFTIGIWIFPVFMIPNIPSFKQTEIMALFFMAVLLNILMYSIHDKKLDKDYKYVTLITKRGDNLVFRLIKTIFISSLIVLIVLLQSDRRMIVASAIVLSFIQLLHLIILLKYSYFFKNERFFKIGNLIFILPIIFLFL